ncbi:ABC transporter substrate-binding protein [Pedobacter hiemivivus]|uniref:ABC transporter substrate-binding protein n=1 Tax=Pedobacter hiemivivus TaxID=2530454 RepID=UPI002939526C|nr:ABC transporter substrate-binding protein [Pedobacter hiemivivus]
MIASHPIDTGPFKFKYWKEDEILVMLKNERYWEQAGNQQLPYLDAVKVTFISDKQNAFMNFIKKDLNFFDKVDGSYHVGILVDTSKKIVQNSPLRFRP